MKPFVVWPSIMYYSLGTCCRLCHSCLLLLLLQPVQKSFILFQCVRWICVCRYVCGTLQYKTKQKTKSAPFPICSFAQIRLNPPLQNRCCIVLCMRAHSMHWTEIRSNDRTRNEIIRSTCTRTTSVQLPVACSMCICVFRSPPKCWYSLCFRPMHDHNIHDSSSSFRSLWYCVVRNNSSITGCMGTNLQSQHYT